MTRFVITLLMFAVAAMAAVQVPILAQTAPVTEPLHGPLDQLLDLYVRDGLVYYQALKADRVKLDRYITSLDNPNVTAEYPKWTPDQQKAFWLNAYNAFVLRTVVDHYPIRGRSSQYPAVSIRQIPGAFETLPHRAAGRSITLDGIEKTILQEFHDPRLYLALGRGAIGSPRLRSEAFSGDRVESQLKNVAAECSTRVECILIDSAANRIAVTPVVGWHEAEFVAAFAPKAAGFTSRSPLERAVLAFILPNLLATERDFLDKNEFRVAYSDLDWSLNDLSGRNR